MSFKSWQSSEKPHVSISVVLKLFCVKEPQNWATVQYMYLVPGNPEKQRFELKMFTVNKYVYSKICAMFSRFSKKIADLQPHSAPLGGTL